MENETANCIVPKNELPCSTDGHAGMIGTVVIAWVIHLPNGKLSVSGMSKEDAELFVSGLLKLYKEEFGISFE